MVDESFMTEEAYDAEQDQMGRRHILMVNRTPALLGFVRVLLDEAHYNVTTTNAVPRTFALIAAAQPSLIIVDLEITHLSGWDLLVRLNAATRTSRIPLIITASDERLLDLAERYPHLYGGEIRIAIPFAVDTLLRAVRELIGPA